ncbi:PqqD family peptide modification chaperone [Bacillus pseudomycoides]|uniref:PqqD family peptide modification chaperone n=1 Tax=Bacillus pseudomycoides TaxID=64104 RepID=UPI001FB560AD|nr:PqqD family peptide modification chaperone [Bacillus pseudomycoides]
MYPYINDYCRIIQSYDGGSAILLRDNQFIKHDFNRTGYEIIELCTGEKTVDEIIESFRSKYLLDEEDTKTITQFLNEYKKYGVIQMGSEKRERRPRVYGNQNIVTPISVSMELTNQCQLNCIHCFNSSGSAKSEEMGIRKFIELANDFVNLGVTGFFITGGEPFLKRDVNELVDFLGKNAVTATFASNAVSISERTMDLLEKYPNLGIQVSLDGLEENHDFIRNVKGTFQKSVNNIKKMTQRGISVAVSYTMNDYNTNDLPALIELCKNIGCEGINIGLTSNSGRAKENHVPTEVANNFAEILQSSNKQYSTEDFFVGLDICEKKVSTVMDQIEHPNKCGAGYNALHVMPNGNITPCPAIPGIVLGNVFEKELLEILHFDNIKYSMMLPTPVKRLCGSCELYDQCGNCIASMLDQPEEVCHVQRYLQKA